MSRNFLWIAVLAGVAAIVATATALDWKKVDDARDQGLPKTAIEELKPIIEEALKNKRYPEAIKAICTRIALEGTIEGNKPEERVVRLEAEIATVPAEMKPAMEAILAHWYWHYFQQNRWRFIQRTRTADAPGKDFTTWDLPRILTEIDKHFSAALSDPKSLQAIPIAQFNDLLDKGGLPDTYRPTMYDFLAHEALAFYSTGEQGAMQAEDQFILDAKSPIFGTADEFLKWTPQTTDTTSPLLKAVTLYQSLLTFHQNDTDKTAFADADLWRLNFGHNKAEGETKDDRYEATLKKFVADWADHEVSARARAYWATLLQGDNELVEARQVALKGWEVFPKSPGGAMCYNIIQQIEAKNASITTERVWNDPLPTLNVTYRNVTKVYFRAVAYDWEALLKASRWNIEYLNENQTRDLLARAPAKTWEADLPATADYRQRTEKLAAPKDLKPGFYLLVASHDPSFAEKNNQVSYAPVWVSDLALIVRSRYTDGVIDGFVLNALGGEAVNGATVRSWTRNRDGGFNPGPSVKTDANGLFRLTAGERSIILLAESAGQQISTAGDRYIGHGGKPVVIPQVVFFTDRALYRPGQTISFKGICFIADTEKNEYATLAGKSFAVVFNDPNGKEIARLNVKTDDYGAISGSFTAPRDRLAGNMTLRIEGVASGATSFNVEEYKRPKFQVELSPPKEAARLGMPATLNGKATSYTGAAIGGAKVSWRVVRQVEFPIWCWWWRWSWPSGRNTSQAIAHGSATTAADGSFSITFPATPDPSALEKNEPTFSFNVTADVTDTTGETRTDAQTVRAGFTALAATISAEQWQTPDKPVELTITTRSLDGEGQSAEGIVKIHALKQPAKVIRAESGGYGRPYPAGRRLKDAALAPTPPTSPANPDSWELGDVAAERPFKTDAGGSAKVMAGLPAGIYRAMLETKDRFGKPVTSRLGIVVVDPKARAFGVKLANHFAAPKWTLEPGESFLALWGTGYDKGRAFVEIEHQGKIIKAWWTEPDRTQEAFEQAVTEEMRGGFTVRITFVRENRAYLHDRVIDVPWSNKALTLKWEHFTSKLEPGKKETWTAVISGPDAKPAIAQMVATLYDASLDQYRMHNWMQSFNGVFRREYSRMNAQFENMSRQFQTLSSGWTRNLKAIDLAYRHFPYDITAYMWNDPADGSVMGPVSGFYGIAAKEARRAAEGQRAAPSLAAKATTSADKDGAADADRQNAASGPDLGKVAARKNLNETAFFFPQLLSGTDGTVRLEFTMPEALTEWKFMGFAHDQSLRGGYLQDKIITAKDLMVEPNPPRFLREGDVLEFTVKVSNQSPTRQSGKVKLLLADARTLESRDAALGNTAAEQAFDLPARESRTFSWKLAIPDGCDFLTYKAVGASDRLSDGEEGYLPVLSRRILVTESLPLPIRGKQTKQFEFTRLLQSGQSNTLKQESLTIQMVSQPAWYAVMALPYLMEYPYECSEQVFNRLYANALARYIAGSDPKIRRIFDLWKGAPALDSPLEKNQDLKSVMLEETPWVRQAMAESQARKNVGILFDANRLDSESAATLRKLSEMQLDNGLWPWFPGSRGNEYITLYIATGFGRLRHLGVQGLDITCAKKSLPALDAWMTEQYQRIMKQPEPEKYVPSPLDAFYLYGRSFFLIDQPVAKEHQAAVDFYLAQSRKFWLKVDSRQSQAHLAIALKRFGGDANTPAAIMKSIKERSVSNEEMGMFWRDLELSWWWYRAPIETQAMMIEAFDEVAGDAAAVEECRVWLLKQKQTQDWKTTKATADAIYGLLLRGKNILASDALVEVSLGGEPIKPRNVEAGTGFYEERFVRKEIKPDMGKITLTKTDEGVSWGSAHWQYLEDMAKVTPYEGTPLKLNKALYIKVATKNGQEIKPVAGPVNVGDELVMRVELRVDRDMEYVHLKDQRGSGTEPVNVLSRTKFQDGLAYYESTRDTATHFFIEYLPKGAYVFEYSVRVQHRGAYQTGIASIQCMYAPEFNSHSQSINLEVK